MLQVYYYFHLALFAGDIQHELFTFRIDAVNGQFTSAAQSFSFQLDAALLSYLLVEHFEAIY